MVFVFQLGTSGHPVISGWNVVYMCRADGLQIVSSYRVWVLRVGMWAEQLWTNELMPEDATGTSERTSVFKEVTGIKMSVKSSPVGGQGDITRSLQCSSFPATLTTVSTARNYRSVSCNYLPHYCHIMSCGSSVIISYITRLRTE